MPSGKRIAVCSIVLFLAFASIAWGISRDDVMFYNPFENEDGYQAVIATGNPQSRGASGSQTFTTGRYGKGILLYGDNEPLSYDTEDNLNLTGGTVALWVKPLDWGGGSDSSVRDFFSIKGSKSGWVLLYKYWTHLYFLAQQIHNGQQVMPHADMLDYKFEPGVWTHLVATWDGNQISLYVNGQWGTTTPVPAETIIPELGPRFQLGGRNTRPGSPADTVLDEFYIFRRALSQAEIVQLYQLGYEAIGKPVTGGDLEIVDCSYMVVGDSFKLQGWVPSRQMDDKRKLTARIAVLTAGGEKTALASQTVPFTGNRFRTIQETKGLQVGTYKVVVTLSEGDRQLETAEKAFTKTAPPEWLGNSLGITNDVPKPFTPVIREGNKVSMWGRDYFWDKSFFPVQIKTQRQDLLAKPVTLIAQVNGKPTPLVVEQMNWMDKEPTRAELTCKGKLGPLSVQTDWWVEYDGFAWCALTIEGATDKQLESLVLEVPLRAEVATLQHMNIVPKNLDLAGRVSPLSTPLIKAPFIWLGNEVGGLQWCTETDRTWRLQNKDDQIQVVPGPKKVLFKTHLVDHTVSLEEPLVIEFGLQATPVKARSRDWRSYDWATGLYWEGWNNRRRGYLVVRDDIMDFINDRPRLKGTTKKAQLWTYWNYRDIEGSLPGLGGFYSEWCTEGIWNPSGKVVNVCRAVPSLQDYWLWRLKKTLDENPEFAQFIKGPYIDCGATNACRNQMHGCGRAGAKGEIVGKTCVLGCREFQKRLYIMLQNHYPQHTIIHHQSEQLQMSELAFVHGMVDGEHVGAAGGKALRRDLNYYNVPWFTLDAMRAEFMAWNHGFVPIFLPELSRLNGGKDAPPEKLVKMLGSGGILASEHIAGMLLVHDIPVWRVYTNEIPYHRILGIQKRFGWDDKVEMLPYWNNDEYVDIKATSDPVVCTLFRRPGKLLITVMNNSDADADVDMRLNLAALGIAQSPSEAIDVYRAVTVMAKVYDDDDLRARKVRRRDREIPGTDVRVPMDGGRLRFEVTRRNFRALELTY